MGFLLISSGVYAGINITEKWSEEPRCGQGAALIASDDIISMSSVISPVFIDLILLDVEKFPLRGVSYVKNAPCWFQATNTIEWGVTHGNVTEECRHAFGM